MTDKTEKSLNKIEAVLKAKGERFTEPRRRVLSALMDNGGPMKAYDVVAKMNGMKPMSVYRALDFLSKAGLVHRIESLNAYISCAEKHCAHQDSQYLICDSCGSVSELHNHDIDNFISKSLLKSGFRIAHKSMELHGTCARCGA